MCSEGRLPSTNIVMLKRHDQNVTRNILWILLSRLPLRSLRPTVHSDSGSDGALAHCIH